MCISSNAQDGHNFNVQVNFTLTEALTDISKPVEIMQEYL